jgi:outer membrane immunogenic protein
MFGGWRDMNTGRLISLLAGFLAVAFSTTAASAQKTWTGFYVGVQGGRAWAEPNYHNDVSGFDLSWHTKGDFAGGMAGYNYQLGNVVLGLQGEYNYADIAGSEVNIFTNIHTAHLRNFGSIDGRLGLAFLGNTMFYGIGGVAFGDIKQKFSGPTGTPSTTYSGADRVGWDLGAGIEVAFGRGWTGRIEYRHYEFGADRGPARRSCPCGRA